MAHNKSVDPWKLTYFIESLISPRKHCRALTWVYVKIVCSDQKVTIARNSKVEINVSDVRHGTATTFYLEKETIEHSVFLSLLIHLRVIIFIHTHLWRVSLVGCKTDPHQSCNNGPHDLEWRTSEPPDIREGGPTKIDNIKTKSDFGQKIFMPLWHVLVDKMRLVNFKCFVPKMVWLKKTTEVAAENSLFKT